MDHDQKLLIQEKYGGNKDAPGVAEDLLRLKRGEPLAYIIGTIPFLGLTINLASHPLIPRPETEWWTELLIKRIEDAPLRILDLCAGSGAIGLSIIHHCPNAQVSFGEITPAHSEDIQKSLITNGLDGTRADIRQGDLFSPFRGEHFDIIATNPPYIPKTRSLPIEVVEYEPGAALYGGTLGTDVIDRILKEAPSHLHSGGEVWLECDIENIEHASEYALSNGANRTEIRIDQYGRPRLLVAYY